MPCMHPSLIWNPTPVSCSRAQLMELVKEPAVRIDGYESRLDLGGGGVGSPNSERAPSRAASMRDEYSSLDQSMDSHFSFIQDVSAPQELDSLLPKLHATLAQVGIHHHAPPCLPGSYDVPMRLI